jgi:hypothetical protein
MNIEFGIYAYLANNILAQGRSLDQGNLQKLAGLEQKLSEFQQASKKLSQLIAKSWLPGGEKIKAIFLSGDENQIKALLEETGIHLQDFNVRHVLINWDSFYGRLDEMGLICHIPYPPRPSEVTDPQLEAWVNDQNPNQVFPSTPYIPLSSS